MLAGPATVRRETCCLPRPHSRSEEQRLTDNNGNMRRILLFPSLFGPRREAAAGAVTTWSVGTAEGKDWPGTVFPVLITQEEEARRHRWPGDNRGNVMTPCESANGRKDPIHHQQMNPPLTRSLSSCKQSKIPEGRRQERVGIVDERRADLSYVFS